MLSSFLLQILTLILFFNILGIWNLIHLGIGFLEGYLVYHLLGHMTGHQCQWYWYH